MGKLLSPLTTAAPVGVAFRYLSTVAGALLAIMGVFGLLTPEQVQQLTKLVPELVAAIGAVWAILVPLYAIVTKSSSDKAAEVAKAVDAEIAPESQVVIKTPPGEADIIVKPPK